MLCLKLFVRHARYFLFPLSGKALLLGLLMQKQKSPRTADEIARHWQALAERRRQYLLDLHRSGRWRRYYTEEQLTALGQSPAKLRPSWTQSRASGGKLPNSSDFGRRCSSPLHGQGPHQPKPELSDRRHERHAWDRAESRLV